MYWSVIDRPVLIWPSCWVINHVVRETCRKALYSAFRETFWCRCCWGFFFNVLRTLSGKVNSQSVSQRVNHFAVVHGDRTGPSWQQEPYDVLFVYVNCVHDIMTLSIKTFISKAWLFVYLFHWKSIKKPGYFNWTIISCIFSSVCCWIIFALYLSLRYLVKPVMTFICFYSEKMFLANMNCEIQITWKYLLCIIKFRNSRIASKLHWYWFLVNKNEHRLK